MEAGFSLVVKLVQSAVSDSFPCIRASHVMCLLGPEEDFDSSWLALQACGGSWAEVMMNCWSEACELVIGVE